MLSSEKLPADKSSQSLLQENSESSQSNTDQMMAENDCAEQSIFVPSILEVSVPPASLPFQDKELNFVCASMEPDLVQKDCKNLRNKWRSISEKQILTSCISERLKIQVIEKSKSDSAPYNRRLDPLLQAIPGIVDPEQENADQFYIRNEDTKIEEHTIRTTEQHNEGKVISTENIEDESTESDLNDPGSLNDLTVSLLEATGSLIGRLASLKAELQNSQTDVISRQTEYNQSIQNATEHGAKTSDGTIMAHLKQTGTVGNEDEIQHNKSVQEITNGEECKRNIRIHRLPETEAILRKEEEINKECSLSGDLLTAQNEILNQDEELHPQKDMQTAIPDFPQDSDQQTDMQSRNEDQVLHGQTNLLVPMRETSIIISPVELLRNRENGEHPTEYITEEQKTPYNIQEIFPQQKLSDFSKSTDPDWWIEDKIDDNVMVREIQQEEEKSNTIKQESAERKDLSDIYNLRKHIKHEITKKKSDTTEEKEDKWSCSHEQIIDTEHVDKLFGCETIRNREKGELLGMNNFIMGTNELTGNDDDLLDNTELPINNQSTEKPQPMQTESKVDMYLMNSKMKENTEQKEENYSQEGKKDKESGTKQPAEDFDIERGAKSKDASVKQTASRWLKLKEEASRVLAETEQSVDILNDMAQVPANGVLVRNEAQLPCSVHTCKPLHMVERSDRLQDILKPMDGNAPHMCSLPLGQVALQREKVFIRLSLREQQEALQRLRDLRREAELKCTSDRRRQMLRFQERLSIARNRKSEVDLMDITQRRSPQMTPEPLPEGETERQKSAVRERLEKMKRERTYLMQTRRDRNMSSFRELLDPVLAKNKREDSGSELRGAEGM